MFSDMPRPIGGGSSTIAPVLDKIGEGHEYPSTTKSFTLQNDYKVIVAYCSNPSGYILTHNGTACEYTITSYNSANRGFIAFGDFKKDDVIGYRCSQGNEWYASLYGINV